MRKALVSWVERALLCLAGQAQRAAEVCHEIRLEAPDPGPPIAASSPPESRPDPFAELTRRANQMANESLDEGAHLDLCISSIISGESALLIFPTTPDNDWAGPRTFTFSLVGVEELTRIERELHREIHTEHIRDAINKNRHSPRGAVIIDAEIDSNQQPSPQSSWRWLSAHQLFVLNNLQLAKDYPTALLSWILASLSQDCADGQYPYYAEWTDRDDNDGLPVSVIRIFDRPSTAKTLLT